MNKVNGLKESLKILKSYERKYKISTADFVEGLYTGIIPSKDQCIWGFYAACYLECSKS